MKKESYVTPSLEVVTLGMQSGILETSPGASLSWREDKEELDYFD